jgi:alpha-2-macroglobulin
MKFTTKIAALAVFACTSFAHSAWALQITSLSPQGEVAKINQLVIKFDQAAVKFGDPKAAAPVNLSCSDARASKGNGRWISEREWAYEFEGNLPPGMSCSVVTSAAFKGPKAEAITGPSKYAFNTGGPFVVRTAPGTSSPIDEDQFFLLELNGAATPASLQSNIWCAIDGVGERVPVKMVDGAARTQLLKALGYNNLTKTDAERFVTLGCARRFNASGNVNIVFGKGVVTPSGVANSVEKRFTFKVREPFLAEFNCERESADAACLPIRPMRMRFNAPITVKMAQAIVLKSGKDSFKAELAKDEGQEDENTVSGVSFKGPFSENTTWRIELPKDFTDSSGRPLQNAASFPLETKTGGMPPLAKFAASTFGVLERFAEPGTASFALLPVTLRNVETDLKVQALTPGNRSGGKVTDLQVKTDAEIIEWYLRLVNANTRDVESRETSLLAKVGNVRKLELPKSPEGQARPFEVVGIPLTPGFHVVEIASQKLGQALLDEKLGAKRTMYVRTSALVTNLGVHFKLGRENSAVWVTTLDKAQPVAGATVRVSSCTGKELASGVTDAKGLAMIKDLSPEPPQCGDRGNAYFVSARHNASDGVEDMAFTWSDWQRGIEPWRFNLPTSQNARADDVAHTVLDRTLLRAGETLSMKHLLRNQSLSGFSVPTEGPQTLVITHTGSGQQFKQAVVWRKTASGGFSAENTFAVPPAAKLGEYLVQLEADASQASITPSRRKPRPRTYNTGSFRVEEFRLPVLEGSVLPVEKNPLVKVAKVPTTVQINYVSGGPAVNLPVRVSALVRAKSLSYPDFEEYSFEPPRKIEKSPDVKTTEAGDGDMSLHGEGIVVADKLALTLDKTGAGKVTIEGLPAIKQPHEMVLEATYSDPNGEVQTVRSTHALWPAAVVAGIRTEGWVSASQKIKFQALSLDLTGKPQAGVSLQVNATARITTTSRKRMVGGFYSYDNKVETKDLGQVCSGTSDARGLLLCETKLGEAGEIELTVTAKDKDGNTAQAASSVWVTKQGELWFGGDDHDRIDLLPEKKSYAPGETAKLQVRMPFRFATALVSIEREGIIETQVVQLNGQDPTINVKIAEGWAPNVYVSALVLRGRLREVPWYSLFTWGYKAPSEWWTAFWYEGREYTAPTALVDLSKPAFRLGTAELRVGNKAHQLEIKVTANKESYAVRTTATVTITAKLPNGQPAANAEVALAAVDQALLELMPNRSWGLLEAMLQRRSWGVETSTAQMEIIGRRHYGRKAVPAGGGGGGGATREMLDTLLLWNPRVQLDANGQAVVNVPLNDAITSFKIVAIGDAGVGMFGTGQTTIRATQDLQIISGLPPLVREDDQYRAQITLRNTTKAAMKVEVTPRVTLIDTKPQTVDIPAGESREIFWTVTAPAQLAQVRSEVILWEIEAKDTISGARDALKVRQRITYAVPLTVQQATLVQVDGNYNLDVQQPADSLPGRGGLKLALQPKLAEGMPGVRDYFANYPFICLEQKTSKSIGLRDVKLWQTVATQIPTYLDKDGLANYFPPRAGDENRGSDTLTAYLLAATHEASSLDPAFAIPDSARAAMENGLIAFVEGKIQRDFWSPQKDLEIRKIAAIEALSRYGRANPRLFGSITVAPNQWPTHAVIDWLNILRRTKDAPKRDERIAEATQILKSRLSYQGTKMIFSTEREDYWWWLMQSGDTNTARLILAVLDDPAWKEDMPRLANGFIARQQRGAWHTTTANLWGGFALEKFSAAFEATPVAGVTSASMGAGKAAVDWSKVARILATDPEGEKHQTTWFGAPASPGNLRNNSMFLPWSGKDALNVNHTGTGKPWLTIQSVAAVQLKAPFSAGYQVKKTITPVEEAVKGQTSRGDVWRVTLEVTASADMTWVALTDPIPGGATILGGGLGRDSEIATKDERSGGSAWAAFEERSFESFRAYYGYVPKGKFSVEYTVRLNNAGEFSMPATRVEAMYAPEMFGETPNARIKVVGK